jgi:hypothetical protein
MLKRTIMKQLTSYCFLISFLLLGHLSKGQTNQNSKDTLNAQGSDISGCLTNCSVKSELISSKLTKNIMNLKVGAHLNCTAISSSKISYTLRGDILNIIIQEIQAKHDTIVSKTDTTQIVSISESSEWTTCKCFYHIDIAVKNCKSVPRTILINGLTFEENYNRRTIIIIEK